MNKLLFIVIAATLALTSCETNNDESITVENKQILGHIEKGPFVQGSEVTLSDLDKNLSQTGKSFTTNTTSDLGDFDFGQTLKLTSGLVDLKTSGYFYNECTGKLSSSQISLRAIANTNGTNKLNVNLLTHLEYARVKDLVKGGMAFDAAKAQADRELLNVFAITKQMDTPEKISLADNSKDAGILLAISSILLYDKSEAEFTEFISKFSTDLEKDGTIDDTSLREKIKEGQKNCKPKTIKERMESFYKEKGSNITIEDFSQYIDFNGDGIIDDNDAILEVTPTDSNSTSYYWIDKQAVENSLAGLYYDTRSYVGEQNKLDNMRLNNQAIESDNSVVYKAWFSGYKCNNYALTIINALENKEIPFATGIYLRDVYALRAFILYNMAMSWNKIPLVNSTSLENLTTIEQSDAKTVYNYCLELLEKAQKYEVAERTENTSYYVSAKFVSILKAEILMAMDKKDEAKIILESLPSEDVFMLAEDVTQGLEEIDIYTRSYIECLKEETAGTDNHKAWYNRCGKYGTFTALRRLGKVQDYTNIPEYMNILPIPNQEVMLNPKITQNPGY